MVTAWVLWYDHQLSAYSFKERDGEALNSTDPASWGLSPGRHEVILVLQKAQFIQGWLNGETVR